MPPPIPPGGPARLRQRLRDGARQLTALEGLRADLPGAGQRRRALAALALALAALLLRPWPPFLWLPGWCVGALLLWALAEAILWMRWPRRWR